jgi:CubicO group peptidase (beta-lactamase class C family)
MSVSGSHSNARSGLRIVAALLGVLVVGAGIWLISDWGYWYRWLTRPADMMEPPDEFYRPVAVVKGSPSPFFETRTQPAISAEALEAAASWAETHESAALLVWHDGQMEFERYWRGLGPDQLFTGRSMSKTLAPLMIGAAIEDGFIKSVDERVSQYLPEWANDPRGEITLRHLLQNTAGLEEPRIEHNPFKKGMRLVLGTDFAKTSLSFEQIAEPGTRYAINNVNFQLLGLIVERATGQQFENYLSMKLWAPLGAGDGELYMDRVGGMPATYCCYRATPRDWLRLGAALAEDGRVGERQIISSDWLREMRTGSSAYPYYGYSLWLGAPPDNVRRYSQDAKNGIAQSEPFAAEDLYFLEGGGYRTLWIVPSKKLAILRLGYASADWDSAFIPNTILRGMTEVSSTDEKAAGGTAQ